MKQLKPLALIVAGAALGWSGATLAQDAQAAPAAVLAGIEKAYPGAKVGEVEEVELSLEGFEAEVTVGGQELEVTLAPDGTLVEVERDAKQDELPAPVKERLTKLGGAVSDVSRIEQRAGVQVVPLATPVTTWEVTLTRKGEKGGTFELRLGEDGTVLSEEREDDEAEDHGDDHEDDDTDRGGSRKGR